MKNTRVGAETSLIRYYDGTPWLAPNWQESGVTIHELKEGSKLICVLDEVKEVLYWISSAFQISRSTSSGVLILGMLLWRVSFL